MEYTLVSAAGFHQASECLPYDARGRQCVPTCLLFLVSAEYFHMVRNMTKQDLEEILIFGSHLYCAVADQSETVGQFIDPSNLPQRLRFKGKSVGIKHCGIWSGMIQSREDSVDGVNIFTLGTALAASRESNKIIVFSDVSIAIHYDEQKYYIFDSHSRGSDGMRSDTGTCVLGSVGTLQGLVSFIRRLVMTIDSTCPESVQFDLHSFSFKTHHLPQSVIFEIQDGDFLYRLKDGHSRKIIAKKRRTDSESVLSVSKRQKIQTLLQGREHLERFIDDRYAGCHTPRKEASSSFDPLTEICSVFKMIVSLGPDFVCSCCCQTFFRHSVCATSHLKDRTSIGKFVCTHSGDGGKEWICKTCLNSVRKGSVPKLWVKNGLSFPSRPKELEISNLEERLVSPRLAFMQLREMPRGGQISVKGNIVNVPADVNSTIKSLPRMLDDNETIMLKLKRRLTYKHHVAFENIRPNKVFEAAKWLVGNSDLFRNEGIVINESWLQTYSSSCRAQNLDDTEENYSPDETGNISDGWTEDDSFHERPTGNTDTFLQAADFREFNQILCVAPAENSSPISIFQDLHSEVLSFPSIYCGQKRVQNSERLVPLHYSDICKWELRHVDRRVALCVPNIFYKLKKLQIKQIRDKVTLAIRKCKKNGQSYTAGEILSPGFVDKLTMQDDGFRVLRTIRGSPPYWEHAKRDAFAMIRQLGIPTWFCSFSAAETKWEPLLCSLSKLVNGKSMSADEVKNLSWQEKCSLIKSDPVTCARYFDFRVQCFIKHVLKNSSYPVGEIADYFYRVEFQQRGSPHIHMLIWVKNAPVHGLALDSEVTAFVDMYVTCADDKSIPQLINYQTHRHAKTCRKHGKAVCRFNFPLPPMPETVILSPFDDRETCFEYKENFQRISALLDELHKNGPTLSFHAFLDKLNMTKDEYILAVRSSLKRATVYLKRELSECRVNNYNKTLISSWEANMDIQYILDPYSCVSYIVSYISKGQRGLSNLLLQACHEAREKDSTIREQVRRIRNQFLSSVEIGAQEAAYLVLQMPLRRSTREVIFIDTNKPKERTSLIKSFSQLKELPVSSKDIEMDNTFKRYVRRPRILEKICYADFASWYDLYNKGRKEMDVVSADEAELPESEYEEDRTDDLDCEAGGHVEDTVIKFPCGVRMKRRSRQKVLYWHHTPLNKDQEEHFRQQIMLFTAWRDENRDLSGTFQSYEASFNDKCDEIARNKAHYEYLDPGLYEQLMTETGLDALETNVENQHREAIDEEEGVSCSKQFECFDPGTAEDEDVYDLGQDLGVARQKVSSLVNIPTNSHCDFSAFKASVQQLNCEQKTFFYHILHAVKTDPEPFYIFLSGGAGVGKSVLIRTLYQALERYFNHRRDKDPSTLKVLLCAPTGKAAHNIGGNTLHSAFCIPVSQGFHFKPLDMQQLNTLRARFRDLQVVIIDEISMVGRNMLNFINLRLQEIMGSVKPFGGTSILAVGDLYQLKPVMDAWVFSVSVQTAHLSCLARNLWVDLFKFFELTEIMRQKDDQEFALLLNRLREGKHTTKDLDILKACCTEPCQAGHSKLPHIFCRKDDACNHNAALLSTLPQSEILRVEALDCISGDLNASLQETVLTKVSTDPNKTMGLSKVLTLGVGVPCDICLNLDVNDGLTNGASCVVTKFDFRVPNSDRCSIVWVEFEDSSIGSLWRRKYRHLYESGINPSWVPIFETTRKFPVKHYKTYLVVRRQFPLVVAAGKTIHKAQGSTMKTCVMHFGNRSVPHLHYVGLSRVTSLSGVSIIKFNERKITTSSDVHEEMERLRHERLLNPLVPSLSHYVDETIICFQNCRSLSQHIDDIRHESNMLNAHLIGFAETRVHDPALCSNMYAVDGFTVHSSTSCTSAHGIAVYSKRKVKHFSVHTFSNIECAMVKTETNLVVCFVYCSPAQATVQNYTSFMRQLMGMIPDVQTFLMLGDFNVDFIEDRFLARLMKHTYNLRQLIQSVTTDYGSCLDHVYTYCSDTCSLASGTLESYYSDHKPLYLVYKK